MLGICTSCVCLFSTQARIGCQIPGTRASLEMAAIWVLGTDLRASAGIASSFSHWAISSAPPAFLFIQPRTTCPGVASHNALGPLISIVSQENIPWTCLHTNLTEAFSQLRIPLATWLQLPSTLPSTNHIITMKYRHSRVASGTLHCGHRLASGSEPSQECPLFSRVFSMLIHWRPKSRNKAVKWVKRMTNKLSLFAPYTAFKKSTKLTLQATAALV